MPRDPGRNSRSVAIVGAGLAGLTAAHRLKEAGLEPCLFEASDQVGGRSQTVEHQGWLLDTGAAAIASSYSAYLALIEEMGLADRVVAASPHLGIFRDGRIHHLNMNAMVRSAMTTRLISPSSKLGLWKLLLDLWLAIRRGQLDYGDLGKSAPLDTETAEEYGARVLNQESSDYLIDPIVRTMLIADAGRISKVELFSGIANIFSAKIFALRGGQGYLSRVLASRLDVRLRQEVTRVSWAGKRLQVDVRGANGQESSTIFDACVIACPLPAAARICADVFPPLSSLARGLDYTKAITVAVGTRKSPKSPAFLVQMPAREDADVALLFLDHNKCPDRAPPGKGLISCNWEAEAAARWFGRSDEEIRERTLSTVTRVFGELRDQVEFSHVTRWNNALPYSRVGSYKLIGDFNAQLDRRSSLQFASDFMSAAGQNTAVRFGSMAATNLLNNSGA